MNRVEHETKAEGYLLVNISGMLLTRYCEELQLDRVGNSCCYLADSLTKI